MHIHTSVTDNLDNLIVVFHNISNHHFVHIKLIQCYLSVISQENWGLGGEMCQQNDRFSQAPNDRIKMLAFYVSKSVNITHIMVNYSCFITS